MELQVFLGTTFVGALKNVGGDTTHFKLADSYRRLAVRPVLGQTFEDFPDRERTATLRLPPFFSNLLPEGRLRELIARQVEVSAERELHLLRRLGQDLPGNVLVVPVDDSDVAGDQTELPFIEEDERPGGLRFSLAGVQLKFSMRGTDRGLTLPARGRDGDWIVKLPDLAFAQVPENEWSMMTWAKASGLDIPDVRLVPVDSLESLPPEATVNIGEKDCYAVRRFDRAEGNRRIHIEDFAQIFDVYPTQKGKYKTTNYETLANVILNVGGPADLEEFVRRLVFIALSGNADAHLKNWSLIYPGSGVRGRLAPAYDLVSTIVFPNVDNTLALNFNGGRSFENVALGGFARLARKLKPPRDEAEVMGWAREAATRCHTAWKAMKRELRLSEEARSVIDSHMEKILPLLG